MNDQKTNDLKKKKSFVKKFLAVATIIVILFSPALLLVDFVRYSPFVGLVWILCVAYFIFVKSRMPQQAPPKENPDDKNDEKNGRRENDKK